jgi:hypothetical protein
MVVFVAVAYFAVQGGIAVKQKLETRRDPKIEGDFIVALPNHPKEATLPQQMRRSFTNLARRLSASRPPTKEEQQQQQDAAADSTFLPGQEVVLKNMEDSNLNGTRALVMQDLGGSRGVLVQFLEKQEGYDNYHKTGIQLPAENLEAIVIDCADDSNPIQGLVPTIGSLVELQHLSDHSEKNGLCGIVVEPYDGMTVGRVTVQLLQDDKEVVVSVNPENCKII